MGHFLRGKSLFLRWIRFSCAANRFSHAAMADATWDMTHTAWHGPLPARKLLFLRWIRFSCVANRFSLAAIADAAWDMTHAAWISLMPTSK
jgi:hypothetical protein